MTVSQDLSDVFERGAIAKHAGSQGMAQQMRSLEGRVDPGPRQRTPHDAADGHGGTETLMGRPGANEQAPGRTRRSTVLQVGHQGLSDLVGQRQRLASLALARNGDDPFMPVEIVERQGSHLTGAQPQTSQ